MPALPKPAADDARWSRWSEHLSRIVQETYRAHHYRQLWRGLAEITQAADLPPSGIFDAFGVWYVTTQTVSVRRQLDRSKGTVSLRRLLDDIATNPRVASRDRHVARWRDNTTAAKWKHFERQAHANFDRFAGGIDGEFIDAKGVRADVARLQDAGRVVENFANEAIAHLAMKQTTAVPTFGDLNNAVDEIGELVRKYASLLNAEILWQLEPAIQYDWKAPFRQAWIRE